MKSKMLFSTFVFCLSLNILFSQTLTLSDIPTVGDSDQYASSIPDSNLVRLSGTSQTWDFSNLTTGSPFSIIMKDPQQSSYSSTYPNSTINEYFLSTNQRFFQVSNDTIYRDGTVTNTTPTVTEGTVYMHFPLTVGNTYTYPWYFGGSILGTSSHSFELDGFGTIITPNGTFNNVYKVTMIDTIDYGSFLAPSEEYYWYQQGGGMYIARAYVTYSGGVGYWGIDMSTAVSTSLDENLNEASVSIYPNPTKDYISINTKAKQNYTVKIYNTIGEIAYDKQIENENFNISLKRLGVKGIYFIQILDENQKLVKSQKIIFN